MTLLVDSNYVKQEFGHAVGQVGGYYENDKFIEGSVAGIGDTGGFVPDRLPESIDEVRAMREDLFFWMQTNVDGRDVVTYLDEADFVAKS